jgi:hypothetical protein
MTIVELVPKVDEFPGPPKQVTDDVLPPHHHILGRLSVAASDPYPGSRSYGWIYVGLNERLPTQSHPALRLAAVAVGLTLSPPAPNF